MMALVNHHDSHVRTVFAGDVLRIADHMDPTQAAEALFR